MHPARRYLTATLWPSSVPVGSKKRVAKIRQNQSLSGEEAMRIRGLFCIALLLFFCNAKAATEQPPAPSPQFLAGIEYDYGNRYAADGNYEQASRLKPKADDFRYWQALALLKLGRREEAQAIYASLLAINPVAAGKLRLAIDGAAP
jgi:tetratricopeptide (TPR) repeat protein